MERLIGRCALGMLLPALCGFSVASDRIPVTFIGESYIWAQPTNSGVTNRFSWAEGRAEINSTTRVVASYLDRPTGAYVARNLDEAFIEFRLGESIARVGRMRPRFGFGDWSELMYTPLIRLPMVRYMPLTAELGLLRQDCGLDIDTTLGQFELQTGVFDSHADTWQIAPKRLDHATARLQTTVGDLMVGLNATTKFGSNNEHGQLAGLDARWTSSHWQVRGEYAKGVGKGPNEEGGYMDVFYRPEKLYRTQFGARIETFKGFDGSRTVLNSLGVRHMLTSQFILSLNYGWGHDVGPGSTSRGWSAQLLSAIKF